MLMIGWFSWNSLLVSCQSLYLSCYILSASVTMWWHWKSRWSSASLWTGYLGFKSSLRLATWMRLFEPVYSLLEGAGRVMSHIRPWLYPSKSLFINCQTIWCYVIWSTGWSLWPRGLKRRSSAARLLTLWVRIPPGSWMFVCCECCVLSEVSATDWSLVQRRPTNCGVLCVIKKPRKRGGYWAVKIQPQWAVMTGKQTNKQSDLLTVSLRNKHGNLVNCKIWNNTDVIM